MAEVLEYGRPETRRSLARSLVVGFLVLAVVLWLGESTLDDGQVASITERLSAAYLVGVVVVLVRRGRSLTIADHWYIRIGLVPIVIVGGPIADALWRHWRLMW